LGDESPENGSGVRILLWLQMSKKQNSMKNLSKPLNITPSANGLFRVYGMFGDYGQSMPCRVWIGKAISPGPIYPDTILSIRDSSGFTDQVMAGEQGLMFG
jgi:hypothetical protein